MSIEVLEDLKQKHAELESQIAEVTAKAREDGLAEIKRIATVCNLAASDVAALFSAPKAKRKQPAIHRYANPADPSQTYAGKGRAPAWWHALDKEQRAACKVAAGKVAA